MNDIIIWVTSYFGLVLSVFWILIIVVNEKKFYHKHEVKKIPSVTLIIPSMNGAKVISETIKALLKLNYPKNKLEIIIAPNNCTDNTEEVARRFLSKRLKVISVKIPKGKRGKAYAVNYCLKHAKGDLVGVLDDDSVLEKDAVLTMVHYFEEPNTASVCSTCKVYKPKNILEKIQSIEYVIAAFSKKLLASIDSLFITPGSLSVYRKNILKKIGGFDEQNLTEDIEMGVRLNHLGYDVRLELDSISYTKVPRTVKDYHHQRIRWSRGFYQTVIKHRDMLLKWKHGLLGAFILPIILLVTSLGMISIAIFGYRQFTLIFASILTALDLKSDFLASQSAISIFSVSTVWAIFMLLSILAFFFMYKSYVHVKDNWKYPFSMLIFLFVYGILWPGYSIAGLLYETLNLERKWHR